MPLPDHEENIPLKYLASVVGGSKRLVRCRHFNQNSDIWILDEHAHNFVELIYFLNGEAQVETSQGKTNLTLYDVLIHPSNVKHHEFVDLHMRQEIINLGVEVESDFDMGDSFVLKDNTGNIRRIFRMLDYHFNASDLMHEELENQLLRLLFIYLQKSAHEQLCSEYSIIDRVVEYVQENNRSSLSVKELADYAHVSESYLSRLMSSHIGIPPMKYVNTIRIENAKQALKSDTPIAQIAALVGFMEQKYFSTVFKRETGLTPSEYRSRIRTAD